jgi:SHS2 domain-containing protein
MRYALRDHTADVGVEAWGDTAGEVFAALADGMAAAMCDEVPSGGERFAVEVDAEGIEAALFDYLDELIYQRDVRGVLPVDNRAEVEERDGRWRVTGSARGVPLSAVNAREVKAVTYSEMVVEGGPEGWHAYVVLDV